MRRRRAKKAVSRAYPDRRRQVWKATRETKVCGFLLNRKRDPAIRVRPLRVRPRHSDRRTLGIPSSKRATSPARRSWTEFARPPACRSPPEAGETGRAGNLTRENIMKQAANLRGVKSDVLLEGITLNTTPDNYSPVDEMRMMRFKGERWGAVWCLTDRRAQIIA